MEFVLLKCWSCTQQFYTANELSTHHLDAHERPLPEAHLLALRGNGVGHLKVAALREDAP